MISYRALSDSYDGWTTRQMEQYIRDLAVFGTNNIEVVGLDGVDSPHFTLTPVRKFTDCLITHQEEMISEISRITHNYGLNMSIWWPTGAINGFLGRIPYLNALFVPSGDPGDMTPLELFEYMQQQIVPELHKHHPHAEVSNQTLASLMDSNRCGSQIKDSMRPRWISSTHTFPISNLPG